MSVRQGRTEFYPRHHRNPRPTHSMPHHYTSSDMDLDRSRRRLRAPRSRHTHSALIPRSPLHRRRLCAKPASISRRFARSRPHRPLRLTGLRPPLKRCREAKCSYFPRSLVVEVACSPVTQHGHHHHTPLLNATTRRAYPHSTSTCAAKPRSADIANAHVPRPPKSVARCRHRHHATNPARQCRHCRRPPRHR